MFRFYSHYGDDRAHKEHGMETSQEEARVVASDVATRDETQAVFSLSTHAGCNLRRMGWPEKAVSKSVELTKEENPDVAQPKTFSTAGQFPRGGQCHIPEGYDGCLATIIDISHQRPSNVNQQEVNERAIGD